jgi:hypothetical protein
VAFLGRKKTRNTKAEKSKVYSSPKMQCLMSGCSSVANLVIVMMAVFWVVAPCRRAIALMMEAAKTSETLVNFYQITRRYNPEDSNLRTHRRENLKSYFVIVMFCSCSNKRTAL